MSRPKTPGPDYYALADGRQFFELERDELEPACRRAGMNHWDIHCILSAMEHRFRRGAKLGEEADDQLSESWWIAQMSWAGLEIEAHRTKLIARIDAERKAVGR